MARATVKFFDPKRGFGFAVLKEEIEYLKIGTDIFFSHTVIPQDLDKTRLKGKAATTSIPNTNIRHTSLTRPASHMALITQ